MHRCSATVKAGSVLDNVQSQIVVFVGVPSHSVFRSALAAAASFSFAAAGICYFHLSPLHHPPVFIFAPPLPYHLCDPIPSENVSAPGALISNSSAAVSGVVDSLKFTSNSKFWSHSDRKKRFLPFRLHFSRRLCIRRGLHCELFQLTPGSSRWSLGPSCPLARPRLHHHRSC